jgi:AcrR family transcriptional regulator
MGRPPRITRDDLLQAARRLFGEKGFDGATLADIADAVGVTPAAVLRHFESKQALFQAAMQGSFIAPPPVILALAGVDAAGSDPRVVLREVAEQLIPFAERLVAQNIAVYMHTKTQRGLVVPFDTDAADSPPRRGLAIISDYFRRAMAAGRIRSFDPHAAALLFMGSLNAYVMLHHVLNVSPKPYPLPDYIDALLDLWTEGAIEVGGHRGKGSNHREAAGDRHRPVGRGSGRPAVGAKGASAAGDRPVRNAGGKDGQRRVARRRPGDPRSDR